MVILPLPLRKRSTTVMGLHRPFDEHLLGRCRSAYEIISRLRSDCSGMALIEFAFSLPIFIGLGFYGVEVANLAVSIR
jgi:Flp pilus assembly protein TadG